MRIAFAGNPNSGKTTMYNALTGRSEHVGNWAGVTVEKKAGPIKKAYCETEEELIAVDLPGAYSMSPFTSEESITSSYVRHEKPDAIVNIVDATNLSRSLFFTTQLLELGIPVVVALNKSDVNEKQGTIIDAAALAARLHCPVIETVSTTGAGLRQVVQAAAAARGRGQEAPYVQTGVDLTDKGQVEEADRQRFAFVNQLVAAVETRRVQTSAKNSQDSVDAVLTNPVAGLLIFAGVMFLVFQISQTWVGPFIADWLVAWIETFQGAVANALSGASPFLQSLVVDGIIGGVGAVIGFLPLVMVMYFLIALLEDCGYMARASVVLDPIFKKVGLSGKSVIPFVIGTGCGIPAIMACRTIRSERERRSTAMLATFMPCGAKMPVIALFVGAFFPNAGWLAPTMYFVGIGLILLCALLVNKVTGYKARKSFFIIEMPQYKAPSLKIGVLSMLERAKAYIIKAGTIILVCNTVVQLMQTFNWQLQVAETADSSILSTIAHPFAYLLIPVVGVLSWQLAAAAVTGFIAKENVVGTLAVCFVGLENFINTDELAMLEGAGADVAGIMAISQVAALAYLMFNLFTPPCFAAIGAMRSELKSGKWLAGAICLQLAVGYTVGFAVYQIGTLITTGSLGAGFLPGLIAVLCFAAVIVYIVRRTDKNLAAEYALSGAAK
ncbi:MAG TPA: ferrous iron transporter B [Firmicutes bacterium]|nr:ferrous iron transporter B [Bacillota bacterium]